MTSQGSPDYRPDPPEQPGGQDDPPDLGQLLQVLARELAELTDPATQLDDDRRLRLSALLLVVQRVRGARHGG